MTVAAPARARQSYRHETFLWRSRADYVTHLAAFVREGIEAGEAVMVVLLPQHAAWLRAELGAVADLVHVVDMVELGRNPARLIPAWLDFLSTSCGPLRPARGIGEPVWPGRGAEDVRECQLHEALLNLAVDPDLPFWLLCPYDAEHLDDDVLTEATRSHPAVVTATSYEGSGAYRGHEHARALFTAELPSPPASASEVRITAANLAQATEQVTLRAASGLWSDRAVQLVDAVRGLAGDSLRRGASQVDVRLWDEPPSLVCQVSDLTQLDDLLVGRRLVPYLEEGPLRLANQTCDLVQVRSGTHGTTVRLHMAS